MINVAVPSLSTRERQYLVEAFDSGWISSHGQFIERSETALRSVTGARCAAVVSNGTTALHLALLALGIGPGDQVIVPASTYIATLNAVLYVGATPVIVDVEPTSWCIDAAAVNAAITDRTAAVIAVDLYGHPADYSAIRSAVSGTGIRVVADAAESIGARRAGKSAGTMADVSTFSFFGNKVVTAGEGGAVLTDDDAILQAVLRLRNQGSDPARRYWHTMLGYNYRMTNLAAAILTAQIERLDELLAKRMAVMNQYIEALADISGVTYQQWSDESEPSPWLMTVRLTGLDVHRRDSVIDYMAGRGIETRPAFPPVQWMPHARSVAVTSSTPVAESLAAEGLSLPTHPGLDPEDVERVVLALRNSLSELPG